MASAFAHSAAAYTLARVFPDKIVSKSVIWVAMLLSVLPDADVIAFQFGIPYTSQWGHRGFTHSLVFSFAFGYLVAVLCYRQNWKPIGLLFSVAMASHALLDMLTNGGRGVALWWPMSSQRIFFPWRPVQVSPIGAAEFFSKWGLEVLASEAVYIGLPCVLVLLVLFGWKRVFSK
jgi:inner membrane protein